MGFQGEGQSPVGGSISLDITDTLNVVVPEPSTWAMMAIGFVGLGFAASDAKSLSGACRCLTRAKPRFETSVSSV